MNDEALIAATETETLTIRVTETCVYSAPIALTDELLDEAEAEGYARTARGVLRMLEADPDHEVVASDATEDRYFDYVAERTVERA